MIIHKIVYNEFQLAWKRIQAKEPGGLQVIMVLENQVLPYSLPIGFPVNQVISQNQ